jgi:hypothetical protein
VVDKKSGMGFVEARWIKLAAGSQEVGRARWIEAALEYVGYADGPKQHSLGKYCGGEHHTSEFNRVSALFTQFSVELLQHCIYQIYL